jgi:hypothetical protein
MPPISEALPALMPSQGEMKMKRLLASVALMGLVASPAFAATNSNKPATAATKTATPAKKTTKVANKVAPKKASKKPAKPTK